MTLCVQRPPTVCVATAELIVNRPAEYAEKVGQTAKGYYIDAPIALGKTALNLGKTVASETVQFATDPLGTSIHYGKIAIGLADTVADAVYHYDQTWNSIKETVSSLPKTIDDWIVHTPLDKQGQFFGEIGWSILIGRAFEVAFTRVLSAARRIDNVIPDTRGLAPRNGLGRHSSLPMDLRGAGLVYGSSRFSRLEGFLSQRYGARVVFDDAVPFGKIDELAGTIRLNPHTATFDVVAHELSHVRFSQAMGKWGTGKVLTNFEVNLMESIGYWGTYRKGLASGLSHADALSNASFGPSFAQSAIQALRSGSPAMRASLQRAIALGAFRIVGIKRRVGDWL